MGQALSRWLSSFRRCVHSSGSRDSAISFQCESDSARVLGMDYLVGRKAKGRTGGGEEANDHEENLKSKRESGGLVSFEGMW